MPWESSPAGAMVDLCPFTNRSGGFLAIMADGSQSLVDPSANFICCSFFLTTGSMCLWDGSNIPWQLIPEVDETWLELAAKALPFIPDPKVN